MPSPSVATIFAACLGLATAIACGEGPAITGGGGTSEGLGGGGGGLSPWLPFDVGIPICDADVSTDPEHCGSCGRPCAQGQRCEEGSCLCEPGPVPSFNDDITPLFIAACANGKCHGLPAPALGLSFAENAYDQLVAVPALQCSDQPRQRVVAGKPHESYLIHKLDHVALCSGSQMPPSALLAPTQRLLVSQWICGGAPNN